MHVESSISSGSFFSVFSSKNKKFKVKKFEPEEQVEIIKGDYKGIGIIKERVKSEPSVKIWVKPEKEARSKCLDKTSIRQFIDPEDLHEDLADAFEQNPKMYNAYRVLADELMKDKVSPRGCRIEDALWVAMRSKGE